MQPLETVVCTVENNIALVTLNRPDKLNALNKQCLTELGQLFNQLEADSEVRCIIITGAGPKAFAAGADIAELEQLLPDDAKLVSLFGQGVFNQIEHCSKPVIAAINGYALGGGAELAWSCHIRLAAETAKFGQPEINLGLIPGYAGTQRLARMLPRTIVYQLLLTGDTLDAAKALQLGLISSVTAPQDLLKTAMQLAEKIASKPAKVISYLMKSLQSVPDLFQKEGQLLEADLFSASFATEDFKEGTKAFLEKRKPQFKHL